MGVLWSTQMVGANVGVRLSRATELQREKKTTLGKKWKMAQRMM
jgi:hypothetical protein